MGQAFTSRTRARGVRTTALPAATTSSNTAGDAKGTNTRTLQEYLGHVDIKNTERYTEVDTKRFRDFWK